jgi:Fe-S cluster assembly protein SufD
MVSPLPQELLRLQEQLRQTLVPPVKHVQTPTGTWGFSGMLELATLVSEKTPSIEYNDGEGVTVVMFNEQMAAGARRTLTEKLMTLVPRGQDALAAEHFRRITGGLLVTVTKSLRDPLIITHHYEEGAAAFRNTLIIVEPGVEAMVIERFSGRPAAASHVIETFLGEESRLTHATISEVETLFLARRNGLIGKDASLDWFELTTTDGATFSRTASTLQGEGASTKNLSIFLSSRGLIDSGATAEHRAPRTVSSLATKEALTGTAKAVYEGTLTILPEAPKSIAFQQEHCLLLSDGAESKASPVLLIGNNDVRCSHAATTGRLDTEKLFYLMSRGLARQEAEQLLVKAFVWPVIETLDTAASCKLIPFVEPIIDRFGGGTASYM